jgi:hypothetical protein
MKPDLNYHPKQKSQRHAFVEVLEELDLGIEEVVKW